jgi:hypothetical protein
MNHTYYQNPKKLPYQRLVILNKISPTTAGEKAVAVIKLESTSAFITLGRVIFHISACD